MKRWRCWSHRRDPGHGVRDVQELHGGHAHTWAQAENFGLRCLARRRRCVRLFPFQRSYGRRRKWEPPQPHRRPPHIPSSHLMPHPPRRPLRKLRPTLRRQRFTIFTRFGLFASDWLLPPPSAIINWQFSFRVNCEKEIKGNGSHLARTRNVSAHFIPPPRPYILVIHSSIRTCHRRLSPNPPPQCEPVGDMCAAKTAAPRKSPDTPSRQKGRPARSWDLSIHVFFCLQPPSRMQTARSE